jgi:hypothetical protein
MSESCYYQNIGGNCWKDNRKQVCRLLHRIEVVGLFIGIPFIGSAAANLSREFIGGVVSEYG